MNENKAELDRKFRTVDEINRNRKDIDESKRNQLVGGGNIKIAGYPLAGLYTYDVNIIPAGAVKSHIIITPDPALLANWQVRWGFYEDFDANPLYLWPSGATTQTGKYYNISWGENYDWANSNDLTGVVWWNFWLRNENTLGSGLDIHFYAKFKIYGPEAFTDIT